MALKMSGGKKSVNSKKITIVDEDEDDGPVAAPQDASKGNGRPVAKSALVTC